MEAARVGRLAAEHQIELQELATRRASLESAYLELTRDNLQYQAGAA
jgi:ABC-2 type transport system ATP-binding protein